MKKVIVIIGLLFIGIITFAQAPEKMNYQAVARDLSGIPLANTVVDLQFDIIQGSASGAVTYSETQSKTTNQFGLFSAEIGDGTVALGSFSAIAWGANAYYLRITVNGDVMPATQLLSVPYALYSKTSGGGGSVLTAGSGIDITGGVITSTLDTSISNELQTLTTNVTNDTVFLSQNGGFVYIPTITGDNWGADSVNVLGTNITGNGTLADPLVVIDNDTSLTNEFQDLSWNTTDSNIIDLNNGTGIQLSSNAPLANQVLTWNGANWIAQTVGGGWQKGAGNDIYNNTDSVGIGTTNPKSILQIGDFQHVFPVSISATEEYALSTYNTFWDGSVLRNTKGGASAISMMGDDNGEPVFNWLLFPSQPIGVDVTLINPSNKMTLKGKGLGINVDNPDGGLDVGSQDSASIVMQEPDDGSQATLIYNIGSEHIGLRAPSSLSSGSYNLTYPLALPATSGSSLVSDLTGNLSWAAPVASPWTESLNLIYPTNLTNKVGIGMNSPAAKLDVLSTLVDNSPVTTQIVNKNNTATNFRSLYVDAQSSGAAVEYAAAQFISTGPGATGNSIGIRSSATGGATNWAGYFEAGNVYIQNNLGIGTNIPTQKLDVVGTAEIDSLRINNSYSFPVNAGATGDVLTLLGTDLKWQTPLSAAFATSGNVTSNSPGDYVTDDFVFGSPQLDGNGVTGNHSRMFFDKSKSAFRAGSSINTSWNDANVGAYSVAFGNSLTASGTGSHASGNNSIASGDYSFLHGSNLTASGLFSFVSGTASQATGTGAVVFGNGNIGNGIYSMTTGTQNTSESYTQVTVGSFATTQTGSQFSIVGTDRAFVIGNGTSTTRSDAFTILKNGSAFLNGTLTIDADNILGAGNSYTLPGQDGAANQVLTTNGTGVASWQTPVVASLWTQGTGLIYNTALANNVGIGTSSPTVKLDVSGGVNILHASGNPLVIRSTTDGFGFRVRESDNGNDAVSIFGYASRGRIVINDAGTANINFDANSSLNSYINAGNFGVGTNAPNTSLDVAKDIAFRELVSTTTTNAISNMNGTAGTSFINFTSQTTNFSIFSIADGVDGKILRLYNSTAFNMTVMNDTGTANSILTMSGGSISTIGKGVITLQYSANEARWIVVSIVQ